MTEPPYVLPYLPAGALPPPGLPKEAYTPWWRRVWAFVIDWTPIWTVVVAFVVNTSPSATDASTCPASAGAPGQTFQS